MKPFHRRALFFATVLCAIASAEPCEPPAVQPAAGLSVQEDFVEYISEGDLRPFKDALPRNAPAELLALVGSRDTMWYDDRSMVFLYQDSIEVVTGNRANCVGRKVGERNKNNPQIGKLLNYFGPDFRFLFPFRTVAGTDHVTNLRTLTLWAPPRRNGRALPVKYWKLSSRGRWMWTFPFGTVFGEALFQKGPDQSWYAFEIRTRTRYRDGWAVNVYRPLASAEAMAREVILRRPQWQQTPDLARLVAHLRDKSSLVRNRWESKPYAKVFPAIDGALDPLPGIQDTALISELLTLVPWVSTEGAIWKEGGGLETYAPSSQADFHLP